MQSVIFLQLRASTTSDCPITQLKSLEKRKEIISLVLMTQPVWISYSFFFSLSDTTGCCMHGPTHNELFPILLGWKCVHLPARVAWYQLLYKMATKIRRDIEYNPHNYLSKAFASQPPDNHRKASLMFILQVGAVSLCLHPSMVQNTKQHPF